MQTSGETIISPISINDLEDRKMIMNNILLEQTNQHHKDFLSSIDFPREFNAFKLKTWHHDFNLADHCPPIPIFEIQDKPTVKVTTTSFEKMIILTTLLKRPWRIIRMKKKIQNPAPILQLLRTTLSFQNLFPKI
jgi:hypothetical protein